MRIGLFSWESLHSISVGGLSMHVTELAAALERKGNEVHVFTRIGPDQKVHETIHGVHYHRCPFATNFDIVREMDNMSRSMAHYFLETEKSSGDFDIIHGHDWHVVNALDEIKRTKDGKTVFTLHSTQYGRDGNQFHDGVADAIKHREWYGTYIAERLVVCSGTMGDEAKWLYRVPGGKIRVIPNGIWARKFDGPIDPWKDAKIKYNLGPLDPAILFLGRMTYQKGPDLMLEAIPDVMREFPNAKFVFTGDGYMRMQLENRARELGLGHAVRFTGYLGDEAKTNMIKASECVVIPSRNEPFCIVVLEAWSCGKPVISTHGTGAGELVWHDVSGLKVYQTPDSIAWGIKNILRSPEHARWMGKNGRFAAENAFSWDKIAEQTLAVYKEIL